MPASSRALALVNLLKTMIGAGLLTLPFATSQVGLILSFFGLAVLAFLSQVAIRMCVRCAAYAPSARGGWAGRFFLLRLYTIRHDALHTSARRPGLDLNRTTS